MAKQVLDIQAGKGMTTSQSNEHLRNAGTGERLKNWSGNYDPTREHLNFEVQKGGIIVPVDKSKSIPKSIKENLAARGIVDPNAKLIKEGKKPNRRIVANMILGGSREQMHSLAFGEQQVDLEPGVDNSAIVRKPEIENWAKDMYRFVSETFGVNNIIRFIVHLDETNPHIHCTMLPITEENKFSWRKVFVGKDNSKQEYQKRMIELHNAAAAINAKYGLERGDRIAETGAKHRSMEEYHKSVGKELRQQNKALYNEGQELKRTIAEQKEVVERNKGTISAQEKQIKHAEARCRALRTMMAHLEQSKADLEKEIRQLEKDRDAGRISAEEAAKKMDAITKNLDDVKAKILDKEDKLRIADEQLEDLKCQTQEWETKYRDVSEKLDNATSELNRQAIKDMQAFGYNWMAAQMTGKKYLYNSYKDTLPPEQQQVAESTKSVLLDGTGLEKAATDMIAVSHVATALFLGYLDKATTIAESHGGGGGPGSGWGKKDDEDDLAFRRRCFGMAMMMMRPAKVKQKVGMRR